MKNLFVQDAELIKEAQIRSWEGNNFLKRIIFLHSYFILFQKRFKITFQMHRPQKNKLN